MGCGCAKGTCNCVILPGDGIDIAGAGTTLDPLVISATGGGSGITVTDTNSVDLTLSGSDLTADLKVDPSGTNQLSVSPAGVYVAPSGGGGTTNVNVGDTATVDMTRTGTGTGGDPFIISGVTKIDPVGGNLVTGASGLLVSAESVQDTVGNSFGNGLVYDDAMRARLSTDGLNGASFGTDGGIYVGGNARVAQRRAAGAVAFSWDDGWSTHPAIAAAHQLRGQKATFYVTSNLLGTSQHMPASAMATMVAMGHEIGCHSADHTDMTTLTPTTRIPQWASAATLEGIIGGGYKVRSYAYPLGNNNLATNTEAYGRFDRVATIGLSQGYYTGANGYVPWEYESPSDAEVFRHGRFPWSQTTHAQFMQMLEVARRRPIVLPAYAHQIGNPDTPTQIQVDEAMDFCLANGIPCLTAAEAFPGQKIPNPGFETGLDGWVVITAGTFGNAAVVDTVTDAPPTGYSGTKSLRIVAPSGMTSADSVHVFQLIPVKPNKAYTLSGQVRHDATPVGAGKFSVRINEYTQIGTSIAGKSLRGNASTTSWSQSLITPAVDAASYTLAGKTGPDTRFMTVGYHVQEFAGTFYGDHIYFGPTEEGLLG